MSISDLTDEKIIQLLQEFSRKRTGYESVEQQYYCEIFERYSGQVYSLSRYFGLRSNDANDLVQEAFIRLFEKIHYFKTERPFKPYFFKMVTNLVRNKFRDLKRRKNLPLDDFENNMDGKENFEDEFGKREQLRCIINSLPEKMKEVFILKIYGMVEPPEIAEILGISIKTVYYRLEKGAAMVKEQWEGQL